MKARCPPPAAMRISYADSPDTGSAGTLTRSHSVRAGCRSAPVTVKGQGAALVDDPVTDRGGRWPPLRAPPSGTRIVGSTESEGVRFPKRSPSGAKGESSALRRNRRPRKYSGNPLSTPSTANHSGSARAAWWKSPQWTNPPFKGSIPSSSRRRSSRREAASGLNTANPVPALVDSSTNRANSVPNRTGSTPTSIRDSACRKVNSPLTVADSVSTWIQPRRTAPEPALFKTRLPSDGISNVISESNRSRTGRASGL